MCNYPKDPTCPWHQVQIQFQGWHDSTISNPFSPILPNSAIRSANHSNLFFPKKYQAPSPIQAFPPLRRKGSKGIRTCLSKGKKQKWTLEGSWQSAHRTDVQRNILYVQGTASQSLRLLKIYWIQPPLYSWTYSSCLPKKNLYLKDV